MKKIKVRSKSWFKRAKDKMPSVSVCFSKLKVKSKVGKVAFVIVPLILAGGGVALGVTLTQNRDKPVDKIETDVNKDTRRIYLASSDHLTIPLTVKVEKRATVGEQIKDLFNLLKSDSKANTNSIKGVIPSATKLNSLEVFNDELVLDVSSEFLEYDQAQEVNVLESLIYTFSEYPNINMMSLYVDGEKLDKMPKTNISIPDFLDSRYGINRDHKNTTDVAGKNMLNVYYTKTYDAVSYLIPVSQYVDAKDSLELQFVNAINEPVDSSKGLTPSTVYQYIEKTQSNTDASKFRLSLKETAMKEEGVIKKDIYDIVSLTIDEYDSDLEVSFLVEDEEMMVEGIIDPNSYTVSDLIYNQVKL